MPTNISVDVHNCFVKNYFNAEKTKVFVKIENVEFHISENNTKYVAYYLDYVLSDISP